MFCSTCGKEINDSAVVCIGCGCKVTNDLQESDFSWVSTLLLCLFLGGFGAHRFYTKQTGSAVAQLLLTLSVFGTIISAPWAFVDFIMILTNSFKAKNGTNLSR